MQLKSLIVLACLILLASPLVVEAGRGRGRGRWSRWGKRRGPNNKWGGGRKWWDRWADAATEAPTANVGTFNAGLYPVNEPIVTERRSLVVEYLAGDAALAFDALCVQELWREADRTSLTYLVEESGSTNLYIPTHTDNGDESTFVANCIATRLATCGTGTNSDYNNIAVVEGACAKATSAECYNIVKDPAYCAAAGCDVGDAACCNVAFAAEKLDCVQQTCHEDPDYVSSSRHCHVCLSSVLHQIEDGDGAEFGSLPEQVFAQCKGEGSRRSSVTYDIQPEGECKLFNGDSGLALLTRVEPTETGSHDLPSTYVRREVLWAKVPLDIGETYVFCTQLISDEGLLVLPRAYNANSNALVPAAGQRSFVNFVNADGSPWSRWASFEEENAAQFADLLAFVDATAGDAQTIVLGDFGAGPVRFATAYNNFVTSGGFSVPYVEAGGACTSCKSNAIADLAADAPDDVVDHVFVRNLVSDDLSAETTRFADEVEGEAQHQGEIEAYPYSGHYGVAVHLEGAGCPLECAFGTRCVLKEFVGRGRWAGTMRARCCQTSTDESSSDESDNGSNSDRDASANVARGGGWNRGRGGFCY